jgi:hypothetical protein
VRSTRSSRSSLSVASEPRGCAWWRSHRTASDGGGEGSIGLSSNKATGVCVIDSAVLVVLRAVVLIVVGVGVAANGFRLRVVKVFLVERSNTLGTLGRVLLWVIRRQRTQDRQTVSVVAEVIDAEALLVCRQRTLRLRCDKSWAQGLTLTGRRGSDLEAITVA